MIRKGRIIFLIEEALLVLKSNDLAILEGKKDILTSFKRQKLPIRPNKRLHLSVVSSLRTNNQNKINITL